MSTTQTPSSNFTLTNASIVTSPTVTTTGAVSSTGAPQIPGTKDYFHIGTYYAGQTINSSSTCSDVAGGGSTGAWTASATYPSQSDVPPQVCVNTYDVHGKEGTPSTNPVDYNPQQQKDNAIQQKLIDPTQGQACVTPSPTPVPVGVIGGVLAAVVIGGTFGYVQWRSSRRRRAAASL